MKKLRILIPTDYSLIARKAAEYAVSLSSNIDAEYILLHCDNIPRPAYAFVNKIDEILRAESIKTGNELAESIRKSTGIDAKISCDMVHGDPIEVLETYSQEHKIDLIVMGTKGESVIQNKIFGSVAAGVLEHISCPTIFVPANADTSNKPENIAFATDLTNIDEEIEELISFAQFFSATINVVHVYPDLIDPSTFDEEATKLELIANTNYPQLTFNAVMDSDIIAGLDKFVDSDHPDLIAMFTYKTGILEYLFNTSYTEEMTMHSKTPLLIMRKK
ncbi:MAG: universal stress protein [Flavobacteriales bacterium]|nr:universal stress protein [Flavobacteriales bacterium]